MRERGPVIVVLILVFFVRKSLAVILYMNVLIVELVLIEMTCSLIIHSVGLFGAIAFESHQWRQARISFRDVGNARKRFACGRRRYQG